MNEINLAGCIITDQDGRLLLIHRQQKDVWELPGGRLDPDEPKEISAARQMFEELGLDVEVKNQMGSTQFSEGDQKYTFYWFKAEPVAGQPKPQPKSEADSLKFFNKKEILNLPNRSTVLELITKDL